MWFKNLTVFRFTKDFDVAEDALNEHLSTQAYEPCKSQETESFGWVNPLTKQVDDSFFHATNQQFLLTLKKQSRLLPAGVLNEKLEEKAAVIEAEEARKLSRKERTALKEELSFELLPKAFTKSSVLSGYIAPTQGWLVVNTGSMKAAEEFASLLRESLGSLSVIPLTAKNLPIQSMTHWLTEASMPEGFELGAECDLKDLSEGGSIKCKEQDLLADEITALINTGMQVTALALNFDQRVQFIVNEHLQLKRLKFSDFVLEQSNDINADSLAAQIDADFALMQSEIRPLINALVVAFGGEADAKAVAEERLQTAMRDSDEPTEVEL